MSDVAYDYRIDEEPRYEIIGGEKNIMAASPNPSHNTVVGQLFIIFGMYLNEKQNGSAVFADVDVHLPDGDVFRPDFFVIRNLDIVQRYKGIYGVPDLVVEVLSRSTAKKDLGVKKESYEKYGVKEYWIINPQDKSIQVYLLNDGRFKLDYVYQIYSDDDMEILEESERNSIKYDIKVSIFDDLVVDVRNVFRWWV